MTVTPPPVQIPITSSASGSASLSGLVDGFSRGMKSLFKPGEPQQRQQQQPAASSWIEISPYGFMSRNYINFVGRNMDDLKSVKSLSDGTTVIKFANGGIMLQAGTGHLVELDKHRRVILVRVKRSEAESAKAEMGRDELTECFKITYNILGQSVIIMPGKIVITEAGHEVSILLPNGTEYFAKKQFEAKVAAVV